MRFLLLLFGLTHLTVSSCPPFLEGLDATVIPLSRFDKAVDAACGRSNFTHDFWSPAWIQMLIVQIVSGAWILSVPYFRTLSRPREWRDGVSCSYNTDVDLSWCLKIRFGSDQLLIYVSGVGWSGERHLDVDKFPAAFRIDKGSIQTTEQEWC